MWPDVQVKTLANATTARITTATEAGIIHSGMVMKNHDHAMTSHNLRTRKTMNRILGKLRAAYMEGLILSCASWRAVLPRCKGFLE